MLQSFCQRYPPVCGAGTTGVKLCGVFGSHGIEVATLGSEVTLVDTRTTLLDFVDRETDDLNLAAAGLDTDDRGRIQVNAAYQRPWSTSMR